MTSDTSATSCASPVAPTSRIGGSGVSGSVTSHDPAHLPGRGRRTEPRRRPKLPRVNRLIDRDDLFDVADVAPEQDDAADTSPAARAFVTFGGGA